MKGFALTDTDELPVETLPDIAQWSENYAFIGYDYDTGVGFGAYIGRWVKNPQVWREQLYLYLPDGTILSHIATGRPARREVITAGSLAFECKSAGGKWEISFEGAMRHDTLQALRREPIEQGRPQSVKFRVEIDHAYPAWMFPKGDNSTYGNYHYEQMGTCSGVVAFAGETHRFSSLTYRDHSRGPRNLSDYAGHVWLQLHFPDGPSFSTYQMWHGEGAGHSKVLDQAVTVTPEGLGTAALLTSVQFTSLDQLLEPVELDVMMGDRTVRLKGKPLTTLAYSVSKEVDFYYGLTPAIADFYSIEQPFLFEGPDGPVRGYLQRSGPYPADQSRR